MLLELLWVYVRPAGVGQAPGLFGVRFGVSATTAVRTERAKSVYRRDRCVAVVVVVENSGYGDGAAVVVVVAV